MDRLSHELPQTTYNPETAAGAAAVANPLDRLDMFEQINRKALLRVVTPSPGTETTTPATDVMDRLGNATSNVGSSIGGVALTLIEGAGLGRYQPARLRRLSRPAGALAIAA